MASISQEAYGLLSSYGYLGLFTVMLVEGTGLPLPIQLVFAAAAYLINSQRMSLTWVVIICTFGNWAGNLLAYYLGYKGGPIFKKLNRRIGLDNESLGRVKVWFDKYGSFTTMISRWIGITRTPSIWAAGVLKIDLFTYAIFSAIGDLIWVVFWVLVCIHAFSAFNWLMELPGIIKVLGVAAIAFATFVVGKAFFGRFNGNAV